VRRHVRQGVTRSGFWRLWPGSGVGGPVAAGTRAWVVLGVWAVVSQVLAAKFIGWGSPLGGDVGEKGVDLGHAGLHALVTAVAIACRTPGPPEDPRLDDGH
jgi:hypothetical protein